MPSASSFFERSRGAKKLIVIDLGFLGDSIHLIPSLWELKRHCPQAQLHVLSAEVGAEVLRMAPCVDKAWAFPLTPTSPPWWRGLNIMVALRREKFDAAFNFSGADRTIFMTALTGAKWRLGHEAGRKHFWNSWLIRDWTPRQGRGLPMYEQRRRFLSANGYSLDPARFDLRVAESDVDWAAANVAPDAIHISINASSPVKEWPLEHWVSLARLFIKSGARLTATASSRLREVNRLEEFAKAVKDDSLRCLPSLSVGRLAAVMRQSRLHIGADSGALHLAMALGIRTVGVFREYDGLHEWLPVGPAHQNLTVSCACIQGKPTNCLAGERSECLSKILPEQLFKAASP